MSEVAEEVLKVRLTLTERDRLAVRAASVGLNRSDFVRSLTVAELIPTRLFNREHERVRSYQLSAILDRLDGIESAATAYLTDSRAGLVIARLDELRAQIDRLLSAPVEAVQP
jgi:hypothetical protein